MGKTLPEGSARVGSDYGGCLSFFLRDTASLGRTAHEYVSFIALVGSLFIVSGGIRITVKGEATPAANVLFLFLGAVAANFLGTTGAAMLLVRPWIEMNRRRIGAHHIAFFIFLVANVGGCLTPIGDPPLFLGYLQGIPFWWFAVKCWPMWATGAALLLAIFFVVDKIDFAKTPRASKSKINSSSSSFSSSSSKNLRENEDEDEEDSKRRIVGLPNLFFLALILAAVFLEHPPFVREGLMLAAAAGSYFTTKKSIHAANGFNFHPAIEVAILFAGIFATMIPALAWLEHQASALLGPNPSPGIFYWGTGGLSAVLDNAPTFLGFLSALFGVAGTDQIGGLLAQKAAHVLAISIGAVFFGAATYIGNGPNFMVKAIAEQNGVRMPSFGEFVVKFSLPFLLPVLVTVWLLFFRA